MTNLQQNIRDTSVWERCGAKTIQIIMLEEKLMTSAISLLGYGVYLDIDGNDDYGICFMALGLILLDYLIRSQFITVRHRPPLSIENVPRKISDFSDALARELLGFQ